MLTIQGRVVVSVPDDAPVPPGAVVIEPPDDYRRNPAAYRVDGTRLVRLSDKEIARRRGRRTSARLTGEEIKRLKEALDAGRI